MSGLLWKLQTSNAFQHCVTLHLLLFLLCFLVLLCLEILHFDWLVNWLGKLVLEGVTGGGGYTLGVVYTHTHTHTHTHKTD